MLYTILPIVIARTMTISKTVKTIVIPNNNFTIGYPRYELDGGVAVTANSEVFGHPYALAWFSGDKAKCNGNLLTMMH